MRLPWNRPCPALPAVRGETGTSEDVLLHCRKGFQGRWDDAVAGHHFLILCCRTSSEQTPHCQGLKYRKLDPGQDPLSFEKGQQVQPHRPTGSSGWVTQPWPGMLTGNGQTSSPRPSAIWHSAVVSVSVAAYPAARAAQPFPVKSSGSQGNIYSSVFLLSGVKSTSRAVSISLL